MQKQPRLPHPQGDSNCRRMKGTWDIMKLKKMKCRQKDRPALRGGGMEVVAGLSQAA